MIVFDLSCRQGDHGFEAWFRSSADFEQQQQQGLLCCPHCGSGEIEKAVMAPRIGRKGNQLPATLPPRTEQQSSTPVAGADRPPPPALSAEAKKALLLMAAMQKAALEQSRWVGRDFAESARAMHYGEQELEPIHGEASAEEAEELIDEGVAVAPLLFPVAPPEALN